MAYSHTVTTFAEVIKSLQACGELGWASCYSEDTITDANIQVWHIFNNA